MFEVDSALSPSLLQSDLHKRPPVKRPVLAAPAAVGVGAGGALHTGPDGGTGHRSRGNRSGRGLQRSTAFPAAVAESDADLSTRLATGGAGPGAEKLGPDGGGASEGARRRKRKSGSLGAVAAALTDPRVLRYRGGEGASLAVLEMEAPSDGIFRVRQRASP